VRTKKRREKGTHVSVKLSDEAREVVVLEILRQKISGKLRHVPDDEAVVAFAPGHDRVGGRIVHHVVGFTEKWRRRIGNCGRRGAAHRHRVRSCFHFVPKNASNQCEGEGKGMTGRRLARSGRKSTPEKHRGGLVL